MKEVYILTMSIIKDTVNWLVERIEMEFQISLFSFYQIIKDKVIYDLFQSSEIILWVFELQIVYY